MNKKEKQYNMSFTEWALLIMTVITFFCIFAYTLMSLI